MSISKEIDAVATALVEAFISNLESKPCKGERNDTYKNLIILSKEVSDLVGAENNNKIGKILKNLPLTKEMQDKINKLRNHRELEPIQFDDYIGTKK